MLKKLAFNLLLSAALFFTLSGADRFPADQPYASYWFPNQLLSWSPQSDPNAAFNRGTVSLQNRFQNSLTKANTHARLNEGRVAALSIMYPTTSNNPSQGYLNINGYAFNYWQYTDVLVFWGGSAGEGLILAPNPTVIDAAHRNGVPVLGTVFFPPTAYGGKIQWVNDFLQKNGSTFPVADKLIEVAEYYGFDGFFINQETAGGNSTTALLMQEFMTYFQSKTTTKQLMWYDAMTKTGAISWQDQLNANNEMFFQNGTTTVADKFFIDFGWGATGLNNSRTKAQSLGRSEFELYAGIDVQANGYNTSGIWSAIFPENQPHVTSLGLYCPNWCYSNSNSLSDFYTKENRFWAGANRDPSNTTTTAAWKGLAHYIPENSAITQIPFVTNFSTGQGYDFYVDGSKKSPTSWSSSGWNNLSVQDLLPTWRWLVESSGSKLYPDLDFTDAYYAGNCLKVSGSLTSDNHLKLYAANLPLTAAAKLQIAYKKGSAGATSLKAGLAFADNPANYTFLEVGNAIDGNWNLATLDLSPYAGKTLAALSLYFTANGENSYQLKIGRLAILDGTPDTPQPPSAVTVENKVEENPETASLRLKWQHSTTPVYYYNIYRKNTDNSLTYLGSTPNNAYFVPKVERAGTESSVEIVVQAVGKEFGHSEAATTTFNWNINQAPGQAYNPAIADGALQISRNHACLSWQSGNGTTTHDIYFGTNNPPPQLTSQNATDYILPALDAAQKYYWRIDSRNSLGTTTGALWSFTTAATTDSNLARTATATASTQTGSATAAKAIDGIIAANNEWISQGEKNPWIKLSWATPVTIQTLKFHDRFNSVDKANGGTVSFSDSTTLNFNGIPNDGSAKIVTFAPKTITGLKFQVVNGEGSNVGLSELQAFYPSGLVGIEQEVLPQQLDLKQNYPNPFNPTTTISFDLPVKGEISLEIYNIAGSRVTTAANGLYQAGRHTVSFNANNLASGIYYCRLKVDGESVKSIKMSLLK